MTDALFHKIMPLGVSQLIKSATRVASGQPKSGLDHLYTNQPDKLSSVQTFITGMSDHKLIKFVRFAKSLKMSPRYVRKRSFKDFDPNLFKEKIGNIGL